MGNETNEFDHVLRPVVASAHESAALVAAVAAALADRDRKIAELEAMLERLHGHPCQHGTPCHGGLW